MRRTGGMVHLGARKTLSFSLFPIPFPFPYPFPFFQRVEDLPFWEVFALQGSSKTSAWAPTVSITARPRGVLGRGSSRSTSQ
jgi:hypothetical protein